MFLTVSVNLQLQFLIFTKDFTEDAENLQLLFVFTAISCSLLEEGRPGSLSVCFVIFKQSVYRQTEQMRILCRKTHFTVIFRQYCNVKMYFINQL